MPQTGDLQSRDDGLTNNEISEAPFCLIRGLPCVPSLELEAIHSRSRNRLCISSITEVHGRLFVVSFFSVRATRMNSSTALEKVVESIESKS